MTLKERTAVAVVKQGDTYHTFDSDGVSLLESATQPDTSVPLVRFSGDDPKTSDEFRTISTVLSAMPSELLVQVREAGATSTSSITITLRDNTTVQWGTAEESELKGEGPALPAPGYCQACSGREIFRSTDAECDHLRCVCPARTGDPIGEPFRRYILLLC